MAYTVHYHNQDHGAGIAESLHEDITSVNNFFLFQPNLVPMPSWVYLWLYAKLVLLRRVSPCTVTLLTLLEMQKSFFQFQ